MQPSVRYPTALGFGGRGRHGLRDLTSDWTCRYIAQICCWSVTIWEAKTWRLTERMSIEERDWSSEKCASVWFAALIVRECQWRLLRLCPDQCRREECRPPLLTGCSGEQAVEDSVKTSSKAKTMADGRSGRLSRMLCGPWWRVRACGMGDKGPLPFPPSHPPPPVEEKKRVNVCYRWQDMHNCRLMHRARHAEWRRLHKEAEGKW
jgi:hypothetical protein